LCQGFKSGGLIAANDKKRDLKKFKKERKKDRSILKYILFTAAEAEAPSLMISNFLNWPVKRHPS